MAWMEGIRNGPLVGGWLFGSREVQKPLPPSRHCIRNTRLLSKSARVAVPTFILIHTTPLACQPFSQHNTSAMFAKAHERKENLKPELSARYPLDVLGCNTSWGVRPSEALGPCFKQYTERWDGQSVSCCEPYTTGSLLFSFKCKGLCDVF